MKLLLQFAFNLCERSLALVNQVALLRASFVELLDFEYFLLEFVLELLVELHGLLKFLIQLLHFLLGRLQLLLVVMLALLDVVVIRALLLVDLLFEQLLHVVELLGDGRQLLLELVDGLARFALGQIVFFAEKINAGLAAKTERLEFVLVALDLIGVISIGMTKFVHQFL